MAARNGISFAEVRIRRNSAGGRTRARGWVSAPKKSSAGGKERTVCVPNTPARVCPRARTQTTALAERMGASLCQWINAKDPGAHDAWLRFLWTLIPRIM